MTYPIEPVLEDLGIRFNSSKMGNQPIVCPNPDHDDAHPSASLNLGKGLFNCLRGDTRVITWDGVRAISELAGSDQELLTTQGWRMAPVKEYGVQRLWEIVLRRNGRRKTIHATPDHRWFVRTGGTTFKEKVTKQLAPGDRLRPIGMGHRRMKPMSWGVAHGFTFGDGHLEKRWARVTLFGEKGSALLPHFPNCPTYTTTTPAGVAGVIVDRLPRFFKKLPDLDEAPSYLYGWLAGWFAADGCVDEGGCPSLASADRGALEFARDACNRIGVLTYDIRTQSRKGFGENLSEIHYLTFSRRSLGPEFFVVKSHRERFTAKQYVTERPGWVVDSVAPTEMRETVYCAEVAGVGNFVLEDHIVTGNCLACGEGGSVVDLLMLVEGIELREAIQRAEKVDAGHGGEIPPGGGGERSSLGLPRGQRYRNKPKGSVSPWAGFRS